MFNDWQLEKATMALVTEAQNLSDKLQTAKPHIVESHAAAAQFWAVSYAVKGQDLHDLILWKPAAIVRFANDAATRIAALRKQRDYDSSDGLAVWLHTARAVKEPRVAPAVRDIWQKILEAGSNADAMAGDLLQDAGLPLDHSRRIPTSFYAGE
ncbi:MAG: hypothetical protein Q8L76_11245 [Cypionkella sp.]|nr:hypothetical protein [Cypionkella sp.]